MTWSRFIARWENGKIDPPKLFSKSLRGSKYALKRYARLNFDISDVGIYGKGQLYVIYDTDLVSFAHCGACVNVESYFHFFLEWPLALPRGAGFDQ